MSFIPSFLLRYRGLLAAIAAAGILAAAGAAVAIALRPAERIVAAVRLDRQAAGIYAGGDRLLPWVAVLTAPAGQRVTGPAAAAAGRTFAALAAGLPGVRVADYATTGDRAFIAPDGRSAYALLYTAPGARFGGASFGGAAAGPVISRALAAAAPRGWPARLAALPFGGRPGPWPPWATRGCGPAGAPLPGRAGRCGAPGPPWAAGPPPWW
jgi:hypothetical protein